MGNQAARQAARRKVSEALAIKQRERAERERRHSEAAVVVLTALAEREAAVAVKEFEAAAAIAELAADGLSMAEIGEWCGGLDVREVGRLAKLATVSGPATRAKVG